MAKDIQLEQRIANHVIDEIGGTVATAKLCGVTKGAISQWRSNGIPAGWKSYLKVKRPSAFRPFDGVA